MTGDFVQRLPKNEILVGIPMGLQYSITAIGTMMVQSALNILGSYAVAAFTAGNKIENIFTQAYVAIGTTMATYNAQNIGARKLDRVRQGFNSAHIIGITYAIVTGVIISSLANICLICLFQIMPQKSSLWLILM